MLRNVVIYLSFRYQKRHSVISLIFFFISSKYGEHQELRCGIGPTFGLILVTMAPKFIVCSCPMVYRHYEHGAKMTTLLSRSILIIAIIANMTDRQRTLTAWWTISVKCCPSIMFSAPAFISILDWFYLLNLASIDNIVSGILGLF